MAAKTFIPMRRRALLGAGAAALGGLAAGRGQAQPVTINVAAYGGVINEYLMKTFGVPFERETGIKVNFGTNASLALARLQASSGGPAQWDIIVMSGSEYASAVEQNLLAPYDYAVVDPHGRIPAAYRQSHGVKLSLYLFSMCWDKRQIPDEQAPKTPAEFWDTERFKGKRSLYSNVVDGSVLEMALLADGVALDKLYPLDVDRALRSLERLGRQNVIWHTTNQEPIQQLTSGAVSLATAFNGRVILANRSGAQLNYRPAYSAVSGSPYTVSRASAKKAEAFRFLSYMLTNPEAGAEYMQLTRYALPNTEALKLVPQAVLDELPTSPSLQDKVFLKSDAWWSANIASATRKFREWQLGG
ncbi:extracellular solute-binding protein [Siccirubricoccus phaeus]|uniref:extracellular solute-binding protein n=1 Tax=Siccirubricoccus phaeus TaxID=2595053 RepID=UPI00165B4544|nr:extracellular solute-binding protein [Siccirubricoccus phaeus]